MKIAMHDHEAIQGLWKLVSSIHRGTSSASTTTHLFYSGTTMQALEHDWIDDGIVVTSFELFPEFDPPRIVLTTRVTSRQDPPVVHTRVQRGLYQRHGDQLQIALAWGSEFPAQFSDDETLLILEREPGPRPPEKQPSGKPPLVDDLLGTLVWEDNWSSYTGALLREDLWFDLTLCCEEEESLVRVQELAREWVKSLTANVVRARNFATDQLHEVKNKCWLEEGQSPLTRAEFQSGLEFDAIEFNVHGACVYFGAGEFFGGHDIEVHVDERGQYLWAGLIG